MMMRIRVPIPMYMHAGYPESRVRSQKPGLRTPVTMIINTAMATTMR
jgi:hypothetical protein